LSNLILANEEFVNRVHFEGSIQAWRPVRQSAPELRSSAFLQPRVPNRGANLGTETNHEVMTFNSPENQPLIIYSTSDLYVNEEDTRGGARAV